MVMPMHFSPGDRDKTLSQEKTNKQKKKKQWLVYPKYFTTTRYFQGIIMQIRRADIMIKHKG